MGGSGKSTPPKHKPETSNKIVQTVGVIDNSVASNNFEMSSSILSSIEKLKGRENYSSWKFSMENYLALEDLSKCVTGEEDDAKKNAKAKAAISLSIDKMNFVHIKSAKTVKEVWDNLKATFEDKGAVRKVTLMRRIVNTKLDSCESMDVYVSEIISTSQKLSEVGFDVPDEWLAIFLLTGLNDDYLPMIMAIENSDKTLSSDSVKTKLLQETSSTTNNESALFAKNKGNFRRKGGLICFSCRQKGHKMSQCPSNSRNSGPGNSQKPNGSANNNKGGKPTALSAVCLSS